MDILGARQWNKTRGVFTTQSKIYDGTFLRKKPHFLQSSATVDVRLSSKYTSAKQAKAGTLLKGYRSGSQCLPIRCDMARHVTPLVKKLRLGVI